MDEKMQEPALTLTRPLREERKKWLKKLADKKQCEKWDRRTKETWTRDNKLD